MIDLAQSLADIEIDRIDAAIDALLCEKSLSHFLRRAWPYFESVAFKDGWHFEAICEHLEAVSRGEIRRLLINVPPRHSKTSLVSIAWPVWTWCLPSNPKNPLVGPGVRFLCASYGSSKAEEDGVTARRLIGSEWIERVWGHRLQIASDRDNQQRYDTTAGGSRINTGIPESLGKGGIIRICFPYDEIIQTASGPMQIGDVVENRLSLNVPSYSESRAGIEMQSITAWHRNPGADIYEIKLSNGSSVRATGCHRFRVASGDWLAAREIPVGSLMESVNLGDIGGDISPSPASANVSHGPLGQPEFSAQIVCRGETACNFAGYVSGDFPLFLPLVGRLPAVSGKRVINGGNICGYAGPSSAAADLANGDFAEPIPLCEHLRRLHAENDLPRMLPRELCAGPHFQNGESSVPFGVVDVLRASAVSKIGDDVIERVAVKVPDLLPSGAWSMKCQSNQSVDANVDGFTVESERGAPVSVYRRGFNHLGFENGNVRIRAALDDSAPLAAHVPDAGNLIVRETGDIPPNLLRVVAVAHVGYAPVTYCVTVAVNHNMIVGEGANIIAANCDDPHKTKEVESDAVRESVIRAYKEVWSTRSNDPNKGAEVVVMQRLAQNDLSGYLLENASDVTHLCLPAEYERSRHCVTSIGWEDPRTVEGEPLWPEMYPPRELARRKSELGPFGWAGQYQQAPSPRGGGIVQRDWWQPWPPPGEEDTWQREVPDATGRIVLKQIMPDPEYILLSLDTAFTAKEENDWSACTVWSVFEHRGNPKVMLVEAWKVRLELRALCERVMETARRRQVDLLLIENKASGPSVAQEIRRLTKDAEFSIRLENIKGDKTARLHSVVPLFSGGVVYAPDRKWADMVIDEVAAFPRGSHDDLVDSSSLALNYLRRTNMARLSSENERDITERMTFHGNTEGVAHGRYGV